MKTFRNNVCYLKHFLVTAITLTFVLACSSLEHQGEMGGSVRAMVNEQVANPNAAAEAKGKEQRGLDGQMGEKIMEAYRQNIAKPTEVNNEIHINVGS